MTEPTPTVPPRAGLPRTELPRTDPPAPAVLRRAAEDAARAVAPSLLGAFRSDVVVHTKRDAHDVVTEHDRAAERALTGLLTTAVPGSTVLGEEGTAGPAPDGARVRWIVDPIDGTANFARGLAYWCVSIAAEVDGTVVAGVVLDPVADHAFGADDTGAFLDGRPMRSVSAPAQDATVLTSFPVQQDLELLGETAAFGLLRDLTLDFRHHHSTGSGALNLVHVAAGWSDVTLGFATHPWDVAAGALVLERAGGRFRGFRHGVPTDRAVDAEDYVAVGAGDPHERLVTRVAALSATVTRAG